MNDPEVKNAGSNGHNPEIDETKLKGWLNQGDFDGAFQGNGIPSAIDKFVEVYIGKYGRPKLTPRTGTIRLRNYDDVQAPALLTEAISWMTDRLPALLTKNDTDLLNIRDEIIADLNQTRYLFTLS